MRNRSRHFLALGALGLLASAPAIPAASTEAGTTVSITVSNLRNKKGVVMACMTTDPDRFPRCRDDAGSHRTTVDVPAGGAVSLRFANVQPGTYAIALLHDENENGRADRALTMIPREGFGFSRDAPVRMGPPDFEDAAFTVGTTPVSQAIRMRYML
ncbi:DUF2141 domain-containing protein [Alteraurantiacibacter aquimixticola]|uniref:DUF2141 domain-containing protein n=1 Tax=Alteraurantiacibacter aquimixticola TaxID=2489173 RepID=UPI001FE62099|nr:DUF2141 domain-containing protein [Alteraurantiacibacter aquimixticola]